MISVTENIINSDQEEKTDISLENNISINVEGTFTEHDLISITENKIVNNINKDESEIYRPYKELNDKELINNSGIDDTFEVK